MPSKHLILCCPLFILLSIFLSFRVFSNESVLHIRWPMCWSFSFRTSPSNEYSRLISFRIDWFELLAVQELSRVLQHYNSKAWILLFLSLFMVQFSHLYMTRGKPWESVCLQCGRPGFNPGVGKIPWRRKWQPTPVLLPGKFHGLRILAGYSPGGHKESETTEQLPFTSLHRGKTIALTIQIFFGKVIGFLFS